MAIRSDLNPLPPTNMHESTPTAHAAAAAAPDANGPESAPESGAAPASASAPATTRAQALAPATAVAVIAAAAALAPARKIFLGTFIHSRSREELEYLHGAAVFVDADGTIVAVEAEAAPCDEGRARRIAEEKFGWTEGTVEVCVAREGQFFFPGFIDTHVHASQYPNVGIFGKSTLLDWLNTYTFPLEASLADPAKARRVYTACVRRTLAHGTTMAAWYATTDAASTNLLADLCLSIGQRALVGRVCMDHAQFCPEYYRDESPEAALAATRATIEYMAGLDPKGELVGPILTPRFAPSCTGELLHGLGELHRETNLPIQTHIAENLDEVELVRSLFPQSESYAGVYDDHGLLTERTVLAHAVHLSDEEARLVAARGAKVAHCPCSNSSITSGAARVRWLWDRGVDVGLGTDMSGGYSPSILDAARQASLVSRHVAMGLEGEERERYKLSVEEVLFLATRGGAKVLGREKSLGGFEVGMKFDALLVGLAVVDEVGGREGEEGVVGRAVVGGDEGNVDLFGWETWEDRVAKWLFNGDDRNVKAVWVNGRKVHQRS